MRGGVRKEELDKGRGEGRRKGGGREKGGGRDYGNEGRWKGREMG